MFECGKGREKFTQNLFGYWHFPASIHCVGAGLHCVFVNVHRRIAALHRGIVRFWDYVTEVIVLS